MRANPDFPPVILAPQAEIDYTALRENLSRVRDAAPNSRIWAVIKANGYGHGLLGVARALGEADGVAVARVGEGLTLRKSGFEQPIMVLEGPLSPDELHSAAAGRLSISIHHGFQLEMLEAVRTARSLDVWLKVDTGMHRLGFGAHQAKQAFDRLCGCDSVRGTPSVMTHLANADDPNDDLTREQIRRLESLTTELPATSLSAANSAGILGWPETHLDWVRPGIMLYGISPFLGETGARRGLKPVMTLRASLIAVNACPAGETVGYGGSYTCPENMPVGVVGIGYGDGYPRHTPGGTPVLLNGLGVPLIGRVSMDMLTVDLRSQPDAGVGDPVVLWGKGLPVEEIADAAGTIAYELLCGVTTRVAIREIHT
jgi:alanine racemase